MDRPARAHERLGVDVDHEALAADPQICEGWQTLAGDRVPLRMQLEGVTRDARDLCPFAYDPNNEPYVDEATGRQWDQVGRFCSGRYADYSVCEDG